MILNTPKTLAETYARITHPLAVALAEAQRRGVLIDQEARASVQEEVEKRLAETQKRISDKAGGDFNPNSPKQVKELLYNKLRLPPVTKQGRVSTDEEALLILHRKYPSEDVLTDIIAYRKDSKLIGTFLKAEVESDGCMHTSYNTSGTKTFRISSSKSLWGSGMNLQNIPRGKKPGVTNIRHIFRARPGCSFVVGDLKQAETMVVARILCRYGDRYIWDRYVNDPNFDIHKWAASTIFNESEDNITKKQRDIGKIRNHSGNYCAGPRVIQSTAIQWGVEGIDYQMAQQIIASGHKSMPGLRKWWKDVETGIKRNRTLYTCMGRRRQFFGRTDDNTTIRTAVAFEPQSTVGDVCNMIFAGMYQEWHCVADVFPILQVHDEVVTECPDELVGKVVDSMRRISKIPLHLNGNIEPLIIPIDIEVGKNWRDTKPV